MNERIEESSFMHVAEAANDIDAVDER